MNAFVISDIHGCYFSFIRLLKQWNKTDKLIILGDAIDRGAHSLEVIHELMELKTLYGEQVVILMGNHEDMFLHFLDEPNETGFNYYNNGGAKTLLSFDCDMSDPIIYFNTFEHFALKVKEIAQEEIQFIKDMELYHQHENVLFTHAGFQSLYDDWQNTQEHEYLWIRNHYKFENNTGLVNVFGHTPTSMIHDSHDIWISKCQTYIGIDGGCVFDGQLNAIQINGDGAILNVYVDRRGN